MPCKTHEFIVVVVAGSVYKSPAATARDPARPISSKIREKQLLAIYRQHSLNDRGFTGLKADLRRWFVSSSAGLSSGNLGPLREHCVERRDSLSRAGSLSPAFVIGTVDATAQSLKSHTA